MTRPMYAACVAAWLLAGCAGKAAPEPQIVTRDVPVAVAESCIPKNLKARPTYPDTDEALVAAAGPDERYQLVTAGRALRVPRADLLEQIVSGCRK